MFFLFGLISLTQIKLIGYLSIVELIFALLSPYYIVKYWNNFPSRLWLFLILILLWFVSAVITDIVRDTELSLTLKGAVTPILWASAIVSMYFLLRDRPNMIRWFVLGAAISGVISIYILKPGSVLGWEQSTGQRYVYDYRSIVGTITTFILAAVLFLYPKYRTLTFLILIGFSVVSFINGSRSMGAVALLSALLFYFQRLLFDKSTLHKKRRNTGQVLRLVALGLAGVIFISWAYEYVVLEGWLGEKEKDRYTYQSRGEVGILGGRAEFASAFFAIIDSPILGHGSWARDEEGYGVKGKDIIGMVDKYLYYDYGGLIPTHSHLWGAWVWHGFFGFVFWMYVAVFLVKFMLNDMLYCKQYLPFLLLFGTGTLWHIVFSPIGYRPLSAAGYALILILSERVARARVDAKKEFFY